MKEDIIKEFQDKIEKEFVYLKKGDNGYCLAAKTVAKEEGKSFIRKALTSQKQEILEKVEGERIEEIIYEQLGQWNELESVINWKTVGRKTIAEKLARVVSDDILELLTQ